MEEGLTSGKPHSIPLVGLSRLLFNRPVGPGWYLLRLSEPAIARCSEPGQFVQIQCGESSAFDPLLRRPFSVYSADPSAGTYDILYTPVGRGTRWMAALPAKPTPGFPDHIDVIGPFGNTFSPPEPGDRCILVGGGVGVAPLYFLARKLCALPQKPEITLCMGARTSAQLQGIDDFRALKVSCEVSTEDGSEGFQGLVTELLEKLLGSCRTGPPLRIYGCGPFGMNEALRGVAMKHGIWCEICLESRMACGFGICFGCVAPIRKELDGPFYNRRICWEGPVFEARLLKEGLI